MYTKVIVDCQTGQQTVVPLTAAETADVQARVIAAIPPTVAASPSPVTANTVSTITATLPAGSTDTAVAFQQTAPTQGQSYSAAVNPTTLTASLGYQWAIAGTYTVRVTRSSGAYAEVQVTAQ